MFEVIPRAPRLCSSEQFSEQIRAAVQQRTHSQVRDLQIDVAEQQVTVIGRVGSYHVLQLLIESVKELQAAYLLPVCIQVQVLKRSATV